MNRVNLPKEAQYAPVYAIETTDFNGDGNLDLLLFGNHSYYKIRLGKFDANYGTLLKGDGTGNFAYVPQNESGFDVRGDVRSAININNVLFLGITGRPVVAYKLETGIR